MLRILAVAVLLAAASPCWADRPNPQEGDVVLADFHFGSGEVLPALKIHYLTLGTARRNAAGEIVNGVLLLHGTSGTSENWLQATRISAWSRSLPMPRLPRSQSSLGAPSRLWTGCGRLFWWSGRSRG